MSSSTTKSVKEKKTKPVEETPEVVAKALAELREAIVNVDVDEPPTDEYLLRFLRCAKFNIEKASAR